MDQPVHQGRRGTAGAPQVGDDVALLDLMLADLREAPDAYRPGNYWANYERLLVPELRQLGLRDFRRRRRSVLNSFGAPDFSPVSAALNVLPAERAADPRSRLRRLLLASVQRVEPASKILRSLAG